VCFFSKAKVDKDLEVDIDFELNLDDIKAFNLYYAEHASHPRSQWKKGRINNIALMSVSYFLALLFWIIDGIRLIPFIIILVLLGTYSLIWHFIAPSFRRKRIDKAIEKAYGKGLNNDIGKHKFSITKDKMRDITDVGESSNSWDIVENVVTSEQHLFILLRGAKAYIIPRKAFPNKLAFTQFAEQAKLYLQEVEKPPITLTD
jgi:hypothetical protein